MRNSTQQIFSRAALFNRTTTTGRVFAILAGIAILTLSSYIEVPMYPVPMTLQTAAVLLIAALYGRNLGMLTVISWLGLTLLGLPLLAEGKIGMLAFSGPTGGYLLGFVLATGLVGTLSDRGFDGRAPILAFASMLIGSFLILALGFAWLSTLIGMQKAWEFGVLPFILGDLIKITLAASLLAACQKFFPKNTFRS